MEKINTKKIVKRTTAVLFVLLFLQFFLTIQASAAALNWENPNKNGNNPYKFKVSDVFNSQLMMQVVGCTGIVDKVSSTITGLFQKKLNVQTLQQKVDIVEQVCAKGIDAAGFVSAISDKVGTNMTTAIKTSKFCDETNIAKMSETQKADMYDQAQSRASEQTKTQCLDGIAYTLAKNQLTSMTRYAMNWVNSGFSGDPMYVQNVTSFINSIENEVIMPNLETMLDSNNAYPYGYAFTRSVINNYNYGSGLRSGANNLIGSLTSDLGAFMTDPNSYFSDSSLTKLEQSKRAVIAFENDFSLGGWDGWLALTQRDANNPIGFAIMASKEIQQQKETQVAETKQELLINNGFLSQRKCAEYEKPLSTGNQQAVDIANQFSSFNIISGNLNSSTGGTSSSTTTPTPKRCIRYEVVTPGSIIKDKISSYVNSPERQLELADDINSVLNALFTALISQFENQGLSSIKSDDYEYSSSNMGVGIGSNSGESLGFGESLSSGYQNGSFDLTRDLGNRFIYNYQQEPLGEWDAQNNKVISNNSDNKTLSEGVGPVEVDAEGNTKYLTNVYYTVSVAGKTKLFENGYNGWAVGDRAFWDGENWQNWKKDVLDKVTGKTKETNPIYKRGVIQLQKDYVVAAKELLSGMDRIMPKIGELDYCIPGPNPGWETNIGDPTANFVTYAYTLGSDYKSGSLLVRDSSSYRIAQSGDKEYDNYTTLFDGSPSGWNAVTRTPMWMKLSKLGNSGLVKKDAKEDAISKQIDNVLASMEKNIEKFTPSYRDVIDHLYGSDSPMQKPYIVKENTSEMLPNPAYLEVAESASKITKDILTYNEEVSQTKIAYKQAVIDSETNIYKLDKIKNEVSKIIIAAQKRRDARLIEILNAESERNGTPLMTEAQYKEDYKDCLTDENITFYDELDIMNDTGAEPERCFDELDNDLDGLVDAEDPDCFQYYPAGGTRRGNTGTSYTR